MSKINKVNIDAYGKVVMLALIDFLKQKEKEYKANHYIPTISLLVEELEEKYVKN